MAAPENHTEKYGLLVEEVIRANQQIDLVGWSLNPTIVPTPQGPHLCWMLILSTPSPILGQELISTGIIQTFLANNADFKAAVAESLAELVVARQQALGNFVGNPGPVNGSGLIV